VAWWLALVRCRLGVPRSGDVRRRTPPLETVVRPRLPVDLRLTLGPLRRGRATRPTWSTGRGLVAGDPHAPGPATACYTPQATGSGSRPGGRGELVPGGGARPPGGAGLPGRVRPHRPGRRAPPPLPGPAHPPLPGGVRGPAPSILEQKVTGREAHNAFARHRAAPGANPPRARSGCCCQPAPEALAVTPYWAFHPLGWSASAPPPS
jgi:hypothetical protein